MPNDASSPARLTMTTSEVRKTLNLGEKRFRELDKAGRLPPSVSVGPAKRIWPVEGVKTWLAENATTKKRAG